MSKLMVTQDHEKELQEFVRIISHDLRGPVGHINSFQKRLLKDIEFTDKQLVYKGHLDNATNILVGRLEGILALSRINTTKVNTSQINIKKLIDEVVVDINEGKSPNTTLTLSIDENITITSDKNRLYRAYFEVISNAFKFHHTDISANVSIEAQLTDSSLILTIIDQGIGIEEKYHKEIFLPFKYLNHQDDFSGLGLGLTLSQKNLQSINGTIDVSNNNEQGCKFTIIVPITVN